MGVLLRNTEKPSRRDLEGDPRAATGFGATGPSLQGAPLASLAEGAGPRRRARRIDEARRAASMLAAALAAAEAASTRIWRDEHGSIWRYGVLGDGAARIESCEARNAALEIPAFVDGRRVVALCGDACACQPAVEEVRCPDGIAFIGLCAFRGNAGLKRAVLPRGLASFDPDWFRDCPRLEQVELPGLLGRLDAGLFDLPALRAVRVGEGTCSVSPGAFAKSRLESIEVDEGNPFLSSDGRALYRRDGAVLVALAVPGREYRIREGCRAIAKKAFGGFACLEDVEMPECLEEVGDHAFARTGIRAFASPASLKRIGERAFFDCSALEEVALREGLVAVGDHAFSRTGIRELRIPSSIEELGHPLAERCGLAYAGPAATFSLAPGSAHLELDEAGGLYRIEGEGRQLVRMMDPGARSYRVKPGATAVCAEAFAGHGAIGEVELPAGLREIGRGAFRGCRNLARADLPESVRRVGAEAFLDTALARIDLPACLDELGENALVTYNAHHGISDPPLREVRVAQGNARFYTAPGLLLERKGDGRSRVVVCTGGVEAICIPGEADEIAPYAFNGVRGIRELRLSEGIARVGVRGLAVGDLVERIVIDLAQPVGGRESLEVRFPRTDRSIQQMMLALGVPGRVDARRILAHYDSAIINASSFDAENGGGLDAYEQCVRIVERLRDPVLLSAANRSMCDRVLKSGIGGFVVQAAKHDDRKTIDALLDLGYLDADNLDAAIERLSSLRDAAVTGHLLEAKRRRFGRSLRDFDL